MANLQKFGGYSNSAVDVGRNTCQACAETVDFGSLLDTKEITSHFSVQQKHRNEYRTPKNTFIRANSRYYNLQLADKLQTFYDNCDKPKHQKILTTIKSLRCCCSASVVEQVNNDTNVLLSSHTCKSRSCAICSRERSQKYASRIDSLLKDETKSHLFEGKAFYFLTLPLFHTKDGTRSGVYLKDLKNYVTKLFRRKEIKNIIGEESGRITCYECTFSEERGYNIHAHILIVCDKLKTPAKDVQKTVSDNWRKVTKDSYIVDFRLLKGQKLENGQTCYFSAIKEVVKYSAKIGNVSKMNDVEVAMYVDWIEQTHNSRFFTTQGLLYGLNLAQYDKKKSQTRDFEKLDDGKYKVVRTMDLSFIRRTKLQGDIPLYANRYQDRKQLTELLNGVRKYDNSVKAFVSLDEPQILVGLKFGATAFDCTKVIEYLLKDISCLTNPFQVVYKISQTSKVAIGTQIQHQIRYYENMVGDSVLGGDYLDDSSMYRQLQLFQGSGDIEAVLQGYRVRQRQREFLRNY